MSELNKELRSELINRTKKRSSNSAINTMVTAVTAKNRGEGILSANPVFKNPSFDNDVATAIDNDRPLPNIMREKTKIYIPMLAAERTAMEEFLLMLYFWNRLERKQEQERGTERFVGVCAGVSLNTFNNTRITEVTDAMKKFHEYDVRLVKVDMSWLEKTLDDELQDTDKSKALWTAVIEQYIDDSAVIQGLTFILGGIIMILMGKQIHTQVHESWFLSRYRALGSRSGYKASIDLLADVNMIPDKELCSQFNITISGHFEVRKILFIRLRDLCSKVTILTSIANVIIEYLAWTEMTHIDIILRYIIEKYPELLSIRCLSAYQTALNSALTYIQSKPLNERRWIKILYPIDETKCLNANKFTTLIGVARLIATHYAASYTNYTVGTDVMAKSLEGPIKNYLSLRVKNSGLEVQQSDHAAPFAHLSHLDVDDEDMEVANVRD